MPAPAHTAVRLGLESPVSVEVERVFTRSERTIVTNPWDSSIDLLPTQECKCKQLALRVSFGIFSAIRDLAVSYLKSFRR